MPSFVDKPSDGKSTEGGQKSPSIWGGAATTGIGQALNQQTGQHESAHANLLSGGGSTWGSPNSLSAAPVLDHWAGGGVGTGPTQAGPQKAGPAQNLLDSLLVPVFFGLKDGSFDIDGVVDNTSMLLDALRAARAALGESADPAGVEKIDRAIAFHAPMLEVTALEIRDASVKLANDSSLLKQDGVKAPVFPSQASARKMAAQGTELNQMSRAKTLPGSDASKAQLAAAAAAVQDASLSILQSLSVMSARDTWKKGKATENPDDPNGKGREKNELDAIFDDSAFNGGKGGISTETVKVKGEDGKEEVKKTDRIRDWCGFFVTASMFRGGGLAAGLRSGFYHVDNVKDFFQYRQDVNAKRAPKSIWAEDQWWTMKEYHEARGTPRMWQPRATIAAALAGGGGADIRPGDTCLIDHHGGNKPSHIVMVESYDSMTGQLVTIEGNTFGIRANKDGEVTRTKDTGEAMAQGTKSGTGLHVRDMHTISKEVKKQHPGDDDGPESKHAYRAKKGTTVFGVGRPSLVDYEDGHSYAVHAVPESLRSTSPEQMHELSKQKATTKEDKQLKAAVEKVGLKD